MHYTWTGRLTRQGDADVDVSGVARQQSLDGERRLADLSDERQLAAVVEGRGVSYPDLLQGRHRLEIEREVSQYTACCMFKSQMRINL